MLRQNTAHRSTGSSNCDNALERMGSEDTKRVFDDVRRWWGRTGPVSD